MKKCLFSILYAVITILMLAADPTEPKDPSDSSAKYNTAAKSKYNIDYKKNNGFFYKGFNESFKNFYLDGLNWEGNSAGNQKLLIDFVKSIRIIGYQMEKMPSKSNMSLVFYKPYVFDIELRNGTMIKNVRGTIKQINTFDAYNETGMEKCYTYFVRTWIEDQKKFYDNGSSDYEELPPVPKEVITFLEFK